MFSILYVINYYSNGVLFTPVRKSEEFTDYPNRKEELIKLQKKKRRAYLYFLKKRIAESDLTE